MVYNSPERVFALLIGIDDYQDTDVKRLQGCVNDCKDMESWLREAFEDIKLETLYNGEATKAEIVRKIQNIAANSWIRKKKHDLILIYFAGHGAEVEPLEEWKLPGQKRKIQLCLPYDFIKNRKSDLLRESGQGLLDRDLSKLIAEVASCKGDNIVVILDSCHSASGTRDDDDCSTRGIILDSNYAHTAGLDQSIFIEKYGKDSGRASSTTPTNHVLLAACREDGRAYETSGRGVFTAALTKKLRAPGSMSMSYDELILSIDSTKFAPSSSDFPQHPHCDSLWKDRFIFTTEIKSSNFQILRSRKPEGGSPYYLRLGLTHNIKQDTQFLIFEDCRISQDTYVDESTLTRVVGFQTELVPVREAEKMYAVLGIPKPVINISINNAAIRDELNRVKWLPRLGVNVVEDNCAPLQFIFEDSNLGLFELNFVSEKQPQLQSLPANLTSTSNHPTTEEMVELLLPRLQQIGHFYHHLNDEAGGSSTEVAIECVELEGSMETEYTEKSTLEPCEEKGHLHIQAGSNMQAGNRDMQAGDGRKRYGLKITNNSSESIYFSLFYFSNRHFRIDALYNPPTVSDGEPTSCLYHGEYKTIGYGTPGDKAWQFGFRDGQDTDIGYLKLYWSHSYLDPLHLKRLALSWSAEGREDTPLGRDFWQEDSDDDEEGANDSKNLRTRDESQSADSREAIKTRKIAMFQFRTLPEGPCKYD